MEQIFLNLETKLADTSWTETQDPEFVTQLGELKNVILNLASDLQTFLGIYHEYTRLVGENLMFAPGVAQDAGNVEGMPTQTSAEPEPANRAERRARKTPLKL